MISKIKKSHYLKNLFTQYANQIITICISFISVPVSINYWGKDRYSIWIIITTISAYLAISGLGIDAASGILMTKNVKYKDKITIFKKSLSLMIISALIMLSVLFILSHFWPGWINFIGKIDSIYLKEVRIAVTIFAFAFIINMPFGIISNSFASFQKAYINNSMNLAIVILNFFSLLIIVLTKGKLYHYAVLYGLMYLIVNISKVFILIRIIKQFKTEQIENESNNSHSLDSRYSKIITTGLNLWVYGISVMISTNLSNLIISNKVNISSVATYSINNKLFNMCFLFISAINISSAPLFGKEYGNKNWGWLQQKYTNFVYLSTFLGGLVFLGGIFFFKDFIHLWVGEQGYLNYFLLIFLGIYYFLVSITNINYVLINSFNFTKNIWFISCLDSLIFLCITFFLIDKIGVIAVPIGLISGNVIISQWIVPLKIYRESAKNIKFKFIYPIKIILFLAISLFINFYLKEIGITFRYIFNIMILLLYMAYSYQVLSKEQRNVIRRYVDKNWRKLESI